MRGNDGPLNDENRRQVGSISHNSVHQPYKSDNPYKCSGKLEAIDDNSTNENSSNGIHLSENTQNIINDFSQFTLDRFGFIYNLNYREPKIELDFIKIRKREKKWLYMLSNWSHFMNNEFDKVRSRCWKGIPNSVRGRAWKYLSGALFHMELGVNQYVFEDLLSEEGDPNWTYQIKKDLNRQFPEHIMFSNISPYGELGRKNLYDVLKVYTLLYPDEGYCQGQAVIAAVLLMYMPPRDAFYCLVQICNKYLPGYHSDDLKSLLIDGDVLIEMLKVKCKSSYIHLKKLRIEPTLFMIEWFMCIYCRSLPWPTLLRLWDIFFCEGAKVLFSAAIVLFQYGLSSTAQLKEFNSFHSVLNRLKNLPSSIMAEKFFIKKVIGLRLDEAELEKTRLRIHKIRQMRSED